MSPFPPRPSLDCAQLKLPNFSITETGVEILTRAPASSSKNKKKKKKTGAGAKAGAANGDTSTPEVGTPTTEVAAGVEGLGVKSD